MIPSERLCIKLDFDLIGPQWDKNGINNRLASRSLAMLRRTFAARMLIKQPLILAQWRHVVGIGGAGGGWGWRPTAWKVREEDEAEPSLHPQICLRRCIRHH